MKLGDVTTIQVRDEGGAKEMLVEWKGKVWEMAGHHEFVVEDQGVKLVKRAYKTSSWVEGPAFIVGETSFGRTAGLHTVTDLRVDNDLFSFR